MLYPILQNLSDFDNKSHHLFDYIKHLAYHRYGNPVTQKVK